jgi:(p)ppGpp synthase/HD superfamily hydrolase
VKSDRKISSAEMLELLWLQKKEELLLVKFFDRLHNMQTIAAKPAEKITAISTETLLSFLTVNVHLENIFPNMLKSEKELTNLINKYLSKRQPFPQYYMLMSYHMEGFHLSVPYFENDKY